MLTKFFDLPAEDDHAIRELSATAPSNPFCTPEYASARRKAGVRGWVLGLREGSRMHSGCLAFERAGRLNRELEIVSLPEAAGEASYWAGLWRFCGDRAITTVQLDTFGSPVVTIPRLAGETARTPRQEFLIDLKAFQGRKQLSSHHLRNVKKAEREGLMLVHGRTSAVANEHLSLVGQSLERREARGEDVDSLEGGQVLALLESGAGEIVQAKLGDVALSSILILRAPTGRYYHIVPAAFALAQRRTRAPKRRAPAIEHPVQISRWSAVSLHAPRSHMRLLP